MIGIGIGIGIIKSLVGQAFILVNKFLITNTGDQLITHTGDSIVVSSRENI
jgi:hypothetical protein